MSFSSRQTLSEQGRRLVDDVASRHRFDREAVIVLLEALAAGGGRQAQFDHPALGGMGQWSAGGMMMIGDMFNNTLKSRVSAALDDLAEGLASGGLFEAILAAPPADRRDGREAAPLFAPGAGFSPWPAELGHPASSGAQNDLHYAYFPDSRRLAIRKGGHVTLYDTADHAIGGVSQQQGGSTDLAFTSQHGTVRLSDLAEIGQPAAKGRASTEKPAPEKPASETSSPAAEQAEAEQPGAAVDLSGDVLATIERLAAMRDRGILSDAEFSTKKAELLARL